MKQNGGNSNKIQDADARDVGAYHRMPFRKRANVMGRFKKGVQHPHIRVQQSEL